jgi:periplasmic divalent cation tolerance protein
MLWSSREESSTVEKILAVYITAPNRDTACSLARTLVHERLAACANILEHAESLYWWQGEVQEAKESICIFKTTSADYPALEKRARELHPYEVPCIVALPVAHGHAPFLQWIAAETRSGRAVPE